MYGGEEIHVHESHDSNRGLSGEFFVAVLYITSRHHERETKERAYRRREFFFVKFAERFIEF